MLRDGHTVIEVHDDGLGMSEDRLEHALGGGIGLSNVNERLRTIYGAHYHLKLTSEPGQGTCARVEIPELAVPEDPATGSSAAGLGMALEARGLLSDPGAYAISQGAEVGRPSRILGRLQGGRVHVAGRVQPIARGEIRVP